MAKVEMVQGFISIMALLLILVFVNATLSVTGVAADFGIGLNENLATEAGFDTGLSQMSTLETEPNMLTSLSANIGYAKQIRAVVNAVQSATSILTTLPLVPAWVGQTMIVLTVDGSATIRY